MEFITVFLISGEFISFPFFVDCLEQMVTISQIIFWSIFRIWRPVSLVVPGRADELLYLGTTVFKSFLLLLMNEKFKSFKKWYPKFWKNKKEYKFNYNFQDSKNHISSTVYSKMKRFFPLHYTQKPVHFWATTSPR